MPGTKVVFPGIRNPAEATSLWAYLRQLDRHGKKK
jgi:cytochrome c